MAERDPNVKVVMQAPRFITLQESNPDESKTSIQLRFGAEDGTSYQFRLSPSAASMAVAGILSIDAKQLKDSDADKRAPIFQAIECVDFDAGHAPEGQPVLRLHLRNGLILPLDVSGAQLNDLAEKIDQLAQHKGRPRW